MAHIKDDSFYNRLEDLCDGIEMDELLLGFAKILAYREDPKADKDGVKHACLTLMCLSKLHADRASKRSR